MRLFRKDQWYLRVILTITLLIPMIWLSNRVYGQETNLHPILTNNDWVGNGKEVRLFRDSDGTGVSVQIVYYKHPTERWSKMELTVFGELVAKAYGIRDENDNDLGSWVQAEKDGSWINFKNVYSRIQVVRDDTGKIVAFDFIVKDDKGKEIFRREVKRK